MKMEYYCIRDAKANCFHEHIFACHTPGQAERNFDQLVNDKTSQIGKYPDDYDLYKIGDMDLSSGKFSPLDTPLHIVKAVQLLKSVQ